MATNPDGYEDAFGADSELKTENRENGETKATGFAATDTQAALETKPENWSEEIIENDPATHQPVESKGLQAPSDCSQDPPLRRGSQVDVRGINNTSEGAPRKEIQPVRAPKETSEDLNSVHRLEQSKADDGGENEHIERDSRHPLEDNEHKEVISLFVRNVARHVTEQQLIDLFSKYGQVDSAVVVRDPHSKECRGFGFVSMSTEEGAQTAIKAVQEVDFEGRRISVERAKRRVPHSRTPGAYMGIDRRIRERYAGMKRHRDYEVDRYLPHPSHYDVRDSSYRGRYQDANRPGPDERPSAHRLPYTDQHFNERNKFPKRFNADAPRYLPPRSFQRDQRFRERGPPRAPPVPRESADDYI